MGVDLSFTQTDWSWSHFSTEHLLICAVVVWGHSVPELAVRYRIYDFLLTSRSNNKGHSHSIMVNYWYKKILPRIYLMLSWGVWPLGFDQDFKRSLWHWYSIDGSILVQFLDCCLKFPVYKILGRFHITSLCWLKPPSSALNMTLPAFASERRCLQHGAHSYRLLFHARMALSSKPEGRRYCSRSRDRWTDNRPLHRPCTAEGQ